jgi:hypothetical protein
MPSEVHWHWSQVHLPLRRVALCLDCEACFGLGQEQCPACGSKTWTPLGRFLLAEGGEISEYPLAA